MVKLRKSHVNQVNDWIQLNKSVDAKHTQKKAPTVHLLVGRDIFIHGLLSNNEGRRARPGS